MSINLLLPQKYNYTLNWFLKCFAPKNTRLPGAVPKGFRYHLVCVALTPADVYIPNVCLTPTKYGRGEPIFLFRELSQFGNLRPVPNSNLEIR